MPTILTPRFGELHYTADAVLRFPKGLPAFEQCREFILIGQPELDPLVQLQSLERLDLCFLALPVSSIEPNYQLQLSPEDREIVKLPAGDDRALLLALLAVAGDGRATANLSSPIVVNWATREAVQAVRSDSRYSHEHALEQKEAQC
jgi:flagellar assembly factor FliW